MVLNSLNEIIEKLCINESKKRMAVVASADSHTLEAVKTAVDKGIITPILIGDKSETEKILKAVGGFKNPNILDIADTDLAAQKAVDLVKSGDADFILKGKINSSNFLRPIVKKDGLNTGGIISHLTIMELPGYHKLVGLTDCAMNIQPTLEQKVSIVRNAVKAFNDLGYARPKVAMLCANEEVNIKQQDTLDARAIQEMCENGIIENCEICGPISFDIAMDVEAAQYKGFKHIVAGDTDIIIVPNLVTGNVLNKALKQFGHSIACGTVIGAKCPVAFTSRTAPTNNKFLSIAFSASLA